MDIRDIEITFSDDIQEEVALVKKEFGMSVLAKGIENNIKKGEPLPKELTPVITDLVLTLSEMFSADVPELMESPELNLRLASRDINLSRLLRERGYVRIFRLKSMRI